MHKWITYSCRCYHICSNYPNGLKRISVTFLWTIVHIKILDRLLGCITVVWHSSEYSDESTCHQARKWEESSTNCIFCHEDSLIPEEVRQGQKVINEMITCLYKPNGDHTWGFFTTVSLSFHHPDQFFGFTRQYASKQCTVPLEVLG